MAVIVKKFDQAAYDAKLKDLGAQQGQSRVIKASGDIYVKDTKSGDYLFEGGRSTTKVKASYKKPSRPSSRSISVKSADITKYLKEKGGAKDYYKTVKGQTLDNGRVVRTYKDATAYAKEQLEREIYEDKLADYKVKYDKYAVAVGKEPKYGTIQTTIKDDKVIPSVTIGVKKSEEVKKTLAPTPTVAIVSPKSEPLKLQPTVIPIETPQVQTPIEEKTGLGRLIGNVTDKVQDTKLYQNVEEKVSNVVEKIQEKKMDPQSNVSKILTSAEKVAPVASAIISPVISPVSKLVSTISEKVEEKRDIQDKIVGKSASDITTQRKQKLFNAQVSGLDKSIIGRDYEKEKQLAVEKEKLDKVISNQYPDMPGSVPGLELLNPALGIQGTKEKALNAYEEATALEQKKLELEQKINSAPTPFEKFAYEKQLADTTKLTDVDYSKVEVESEKPKWFTQSQENARDKFDLSNTYKEEAEQAVSQANLIKLGASLASNDLNKNVSQYEEQVNKLNTQTNLFANKEKEFQQLENKYEKVRLDFEEAEKKSKEAQTLYEKNPTEQNYRNALAAFSTANVKYDNAKDIYDDYSSYATELQKEATTLSNRSQALDSVRQQLLGEQNKLVLAKDTYEDKVKQINKLTDTYEDSLKNIQMRDKFEVKKDKYQQSLDYFKDVQAGGFLKSNAYDEETGRYINQVSQVGKVAGIISAGAGKFGVGVSEMARNIPEFAVVAPYREMKEDKAQGDLFKVSPIIQSVAPVAGVTQYWAKGIYDWDDERNKDYNWKVNTNWKAVEGAVDTALLGLTVAKPIASGAKATGKTLTKGAFKESFKAATKTGVGKWTKGLAKGVAGAVIGAQGGKTVGYITLGKEEKDFVERGNEFQGAMQAGFAAEEKASSLQLLPGVGKGGRGDVGGLLYKLPGGPLLRTGIQKVSTQKGGEYGKGESRTLDEFEKAVRQYYINKGYKPSEVETAVRAAMRQRKAGLTGEVAGTVTANVMSELLGQQFLKDAGGAVVAGKGTFWKPAFQIGKAGFIEGVAGELSTQIGRYEGVDVKDLAVTGGIGAVTAGLIGGTIAKSAGRPGGKLLQTGTYIADPYEKPGDIIAGIIEKGGKKAAKKSIANVRVVSVVPSTTFSVTPGTSTMAESLSFGTNTQTAIKDVDKGPSVAITLKESAYKPTPVITRTPTKTPTRVPTPTETIESLIRGRSKTTQSPFPTSSTLTMIKSTTDIGVLTGVKTPTWTPVITPAPTVGPSITQQTDNTFVDESVNVNTITNIFSNPFVPTKVTNNKNILGGKGLNAAWLAAQRKKSGYGWVVENKIKDFAGDFLKKQSKSSVTSKIKSMI